MRPTADPPRSGLLTLYAEEVRALPRARFALPGAAILLAAVTALAAGPGVRMAGGLWAFGFVAHVVVPAALAAVVAARVAEPRASLFAHALFTAPVTKARHLAASVLASLTLGALYLVATLPIVAVAGHHLGDAALLLRFVAAGLMLVAFATALGTLLGVAFTTRTTAPAAGLAAGAMVAAVLAVAAFAGVTGEAPRAAHASPVAVVVGAAGVLPFGVESASPARALAAVAIVTLGLLAAAAWAYVREQGVESWETTPARRALLVLAVVAVVLAPAAVASTAYEPGGARVSGAFGSSMHAMSVVLAPRGEDADDAAFWGDRAPNMRVGEAHERDLLVILPAARTANLTDVRVTITAAMGLLIDGETDARFATMPRDETRRFEGHAGPPPVDAYELPIIRIPVTVTPTSPTALANSVYYLHVNATYRVEPAGDPQTATATVPVFADVPGASLQLALAGAPFPAACAVGAIARRLRTR